MIDEKLLIISPDDSQIVGRIQGDENSSKLLFFCHGFGVKSDSRGMFNKLAEKFCNDYLTVRFHLGAIDSLNNTIVVPSYSQQVTTFKSVIDSIIKKYPNKEISVIAHSQGCYISSLLLMGGEYNISKLVLLAPLVRRSITQKLREKYLGREGSIIDDNGESRLVRTDGTVTLLSPDFWKEADSLDPSELFKKIDSKFNCVFIWPKGDSLVKPEEYEKLVNLGVKNLFEIDGDHDFKGDNWNGLVNLLQKIL